MYLKYLILNEERFTFHLQYNHSGTFSNRKYEELSYPKNQKMCNPSLVDLLAENTTPLIVNVVVKMRAIPSSGTSPLSSYKEVPPRGPQPGPFVS